MREQEIEFKSKLILNEVNLETNKEMTIYCKEEEKHRILKIANIEGKIVIFYDEDLDVELVKWEGNILYKQKIRKVEDEILEKN